MTIGKADVSRLLYKVRKFQKSGTFSSLFSRGKIFVVYCMDQNLAVLWGDQADPKSLGGGPKPILRTGVLPLSLMVFSTSPPRPPLAPPSEDQQYHELSPYATVLLDSRPAARPSMPAPSQQHITTSRHQEPARQAAWCQDSNRQLCGQLL